MRVLAVANQKGGCGKTTTAIQLAGCLSHLGKRTLLIDLDPQGHASLGLGIDPDRLKVSVYDTLSPRTHSPRKMEEVVLEREERLHIAPAQILLSALEQELAGADGRECRLAWALETVADRYEYAILDCAPGLGVLTFNALYAADDVVVPVETSLYSFHGVSKYMETVLVAERAFAKELGIHILVTMYDPRTRYGREFLAQTRDYFQNLALVSTIHRTVRLNAAATAGQPMTTFDRRCRAFDDYMQCATELIERGFQALPQRRPEWLHRPLPDEAEPAPPDQAQADVEVRFHDTIDLENEAAARAPEDLVESDALVDEATEQAPIELQLDTAKFANQFCFVLFERKASSVQIAGEFNDWKPQPLRIDEDGLWQTSLKLEPGGYRYKFIVDGEWLTDPANQSTAPNPYGGMDSFIEIPNRSMTDGQQV